MFAFHTFHIFKIQKLVYIFENFKFPNFFIIPEFKEFLRSLKFKHFMPVLEIYLLMQAFSNSSTLMIK